MIFFLIVPLIVLFLSLSHSLKHQPAFSNVVTQNISQKNSHRGGQKQLRRHTLIDIPWFAPTQSGQRSRSASERPPWSTMHTRHPQGMKAAPQRPGGSRCDFRRATAKSPALTTWISTHVRYEALKFSSRECSRSPPPIFQRPPANTLLFMVESLTANVTHTHSQKKMCLLEA